MQIAGAVNAGDAAPHLRINGGCKILVGLVAVDFYRKCVAVLHDEVVGIFCGVGERAAHVQHIVGRPCGGCARCAHAHKAGTVNDQVVGRAGALARNLKNIAGACLNNADLDAGVVGRIVDHTHKGIERGIGRNGHAVFLAGIAV